MMNPNASTLSSNQSQGTNNNTAVSPQNTQPQAQTATQPQTQKEPLAPNGNISGASLSSSMPPLGGTQQTPQSTYQVPTVGMPTPPSGTNLGPTPSKPAARIKKGGFSLMPVLYVIGGIIFLVVYTVVWAVVFGLSLPFGISLPF